MESLISITLILNLISSCINIFAYGFGYFRVRKAQVDGKFKLTKRTLLFEFLTVSASAVLFAAVFRTVLFDSEHTTEALYLLNFTLLFLNLAFNVNAILLAGIVELGKKNDTETTNS